MEDTTKRLIIHEILVVEGRDDQANIARFVDATCILTQGFNTTKDILERIDFASKHQGVIVFTDPDFAGTQIRKRVTRAATGVVKHAYISRDEGTKDGDIGVENASGEAIIAALLAAKAEVLVTKEEELYTQQDLYTLGLVGRDDSKKLRTELGHYLRIGYGNAKQFLHRLNAYRIPPESIVAFLKDKKEKL